MFYRFEIPIEKRFLTKILEIDKSYIDDLIGLSEIHEIKEKGRRTMLSLHHSSLASLYFKTYQMTDLFPELGEDIKEKITEQSKYEDLEQGLLYLYLKSDPTNLLELLITLEEVWVNEEERLEFLGKLIEHKEIEDLLKKNIEKEEFTEWNSYLEIIGSLNEEVSLRLVEGILPKIEPMDINDIIWFMDDFKKYGSFKWAVPVIDILISKIEKPQDIDDIMELLGEILQPSGWDEVIDWGEELIGEVSSEFFDGISSRTEKEDDIGNISWIVRRIVEYYDCGEMPELAECIDIATLSAKIDKEEDIDKIIDCVDSIRIASEAVAQEIIRSSRKASILMQEVSKKSGN